MNVQLNQRVSNLAQLNKNGSPERDDLDQWQASGPRDIQYIPLGRMIVDHSYQREISESFVRKITSKFDPGLLGEIEVNIRPDGTIVVIDGQHRHEALTRIVSNPDRYGVPCIVNRVRTIAEEAELYLARNAYIRQATKNSTFEARLIIGDPIAVSARDAILEAGYQPFTQTVKYQVPAGYINAGCSERIIRQYGIETLKNTLHVLRRTYGDTVVFQTKLFFGLAAFYRRYRDEDAFDVNALAKVLTLNPPDVLIARANNSVSIMGVKSSVGVEMAIHYAYNHGRKNRLTDFAWSRQ